MEAAVSRFAKILGASETEVSGHDIRFSVDGAKGDRLRASFEGDPQRFMAVLIDAAGVTRATLDVAPVSHIEEDTTAPGRVVLHVGRTLVRIDSQPTLAIEMASKEGS